MAAAHNTKQRQRHLKSNIGTSHPRQETDKMMVPPSLLIVSVYSSCHSAVSLLHTCGVYHGSSRQFADNLGKRGVPRTKHEGHTFTFIQGDNNEQAEELWNVIIMLSKAII